MVSLGAGAGGSCTVALLSVVDAGAVAVVDDSDVEAALLELLLDFVFVFLDSCFVCSGVVPSNALSPVA